MFAPKPGTYAADSGPPDLTGERHLAGTLEQVQANFRRFILFDERVASVMG